MNFVKNFRIATLFRNVLFAGGLISLLILASCAIPESFSNKKTNWYSICTIQMDGSGFQYLTDKGTDFSHPEWSEDGLLIVFDSANYVEHPLESSVRSGIYIMNKDGTEKQRLTEEDKVPVQESFPVFVPGSNNQIISFIKDSRLSSFDRQSGLVSTITKITRDIDNKADHRPYTWASDGQHIIYESNSALYLLNLETGNEVLIAINGQRGSFTTSEDKIIFDNSKQVYIYDLDSNTTVMLAKGHSASLFPDDNLVVYRYFMNLYTISADGKGSTLISPCGTNTYPKVSPDGKYVFFNDESRILVMNKTGQNSTYITGGFDPVISPDSKTLVFYKD